MNIRTPRILVNCTTIVRGGGVQCAYSFMRGVAECLGAAEKGRMRFAISEAVAREVKSAGDMGLDQVVFPVSPARIGAGWGSRKRLRELARDVDFVFTVFGPSYLRFPVPEIMGFADPFVLFPENPAVERMRGLTRLRIRTIVPYKRFWLRSVNGFVVETQAAAAALARLPEGRSKPVHVVSNAVPHGFGFTEPENWVPGSDAPYRVLLLAAPYPHKNIDLVPRVCRVLADSGRRTFRFRCTLPADHFETMVRRPAAALGVADMVENLGVLRIAQLGQAYAASDLVLHPSLLEVFSVTFLEAMKCCRPILASDLPHAREICGEAAVYFRPNDPEDCARRLMHLSSDQRVGQELVGHGQRQLGRFPDERGKFEAQMRVLSEFASLCAGRSDRSMERRP